MSQSPSRPENPQSASAAMDLLDKFIEYKFRGSSSEMKNTLLVVVILITTATYQTALSPTGGLWQDNYQPDNSTLQPSTDDSVANRHHTAGTAVMATNGKPGPYAVFVITNSVGFYMSVYMIYMLTIDFPLMREMQISMTVLSINYGNCIIAILPSDYVKLRLTCIVMFSIFATLILILGIRFLHRKSWFRTSDEYSSASSL